MDDETEIRRVEIQAERIRQAMRVEQARLALEREQAILDGYDRALGNPTSAVEPRSLKTRDVLKIFAAVTGRIRRRELIARLGQAGFDIKRADFVPRLNTILRRQREMEVIVRRDEGKIIYLERGDNFDGSYVFENS